MIFVPFLLLNIIWVVANIIWLQFNYTRLNLIRVILRMIPIIISFASLYPFIKLIFPILSESEEDFLPSSYNFTFFFIIFLYNVLLILYPPYFIPFFTVFIVFSGFASIIELRKGIKDKNPLRLILPSFNLFGKLYFVYIFPSIVETYTIISYILVIIDFSLWFLFLKDHELSNRVRELYQNTSGFFENRRFKKTLTVITLITLIFYLFSWPIYTEFWEFLIIISPEMIFVAITGGVAEPTHHYTLIDIFFPIIGLAAFILGIVCAFIYLLINRESSEISHKKKIKSKSESS